MQNETQSDSCNSSTSKINLLLRKSAHIQPWPEILKQLECYICGGYLSCPPVYETESGYICGRCPEPKGSAKRSKLYEILAKMVSYPCKYASFGCSEIVKFLDQKEHDEVCNHRPIQCPIITDGTCNWKGPKVQLYYHCDCEHSSRVIHNNSFPVKINANKDMTTTYLLHDLGKFYLVNIKVCLTSRKIYHSMIHFNNRHECYYRVDIKKDNDKITKIGVVLPQGDMTFSEVNCVSVKFNSLLDVLGPFDEIYSKVTIYKECEHCHDKMKKVVYDVNLGFLCKECKPKPIQIMFPKLSTTFQKQPQNK